MTLPDFDHSLRVSALATRLIECVQAFEADRPLESPLERLQALSLALAIATVAIGQRPEVQAQLSFDQLARQVAQTLARDMYQLRQMDVEAAAHVPV